ncbi:MAG: BLUF domain-containing protein [Sphingomicrobium sp.]
MFQIAYFSTASTRQDVRTVHDILVSSRINNRRDDITGLLVAGGNRYLQVIEGPRAATERLYATIRADQRHLAVTTLLQRTVLRRCFDGWSLAFRREPELGQFDSFPDMVRFLTLNVPDTALRNQIRTFASALIMTPRHEGPELWKRSA